MIGRALNHYHIVEKLGSGGMGEVYLAEDTRLGRKVAVKILPAALAADPILRERLATEARAVAALNHPNIVTIHSIEEAEGTHFLTMELVEGKTLAETIPPEGLPLRGILDLSIPLADAVAAAHQKGITHRDLKPANVMVTREGRVKVLDFGLAKLQVSLAGAGESGTKLPTMPLTQEGHIMGTVPYMSPEQAEGAPVDPRSDVFSLGVLLYEMATGARPFQGRTGISILSSILKDHPPPVTELKRDLPADLARIVDRCLAKDPARRFQSALGLKNELEALAQETEAGRHAARRQTSGALPARRLWSAAAAAFLLVSLAFLSYRFLSARRSPAAPEAPGVTAAGPPPLGGDPLAGRKKIVVLPFQNLGRPEDEYFAAGMTEEITSRLAAVGDLAVISRTSAEQYAKTRKTVKEIGRELGVEFVLEGSVRWDGAGSRTSRIRVTPQLIRVADDTHLWSDRFDRQLEDVFEVQSEIAGQVVQQMGVALFGGAEKTLNACPTENLEAYQLYLQGKELLRLSWGDEEVVRRALALYEQAIGLDPGFAQGWADLSLVHSRMYHERLDFTEERLAQARAAADRALKLAPHLRAGHVALGYYYYWGRRDYDRALAELGSREGESENDAEVLEAIGYIRRRQGKFDEGLESLNKALHLDPRNPRTAFEMSHTLTMLRRYREAGQTMDRVLAMAPKMTLGYVFKGMILFATNGDTREVRALMSRAPVSKIFPFGGLMKFRRVGPQASGGSGTAGRDPGGGFFHHRRLRSQGIDGLRGSPSLGRGGKSAIGVRSGSGVAGEEDRGRFSGSAVSIVPRDDVREMGRKDDAIREAILATDLVPTSRDAVEGPTHEETLAAVYATVGEQDAALEVIERIFSRPGRLSPGLLRVDPIWDPLRKNPRFQALLEKYPVSRR